MPPKDITRRDFVVGTGAAVAVGACSPWSDEEVGPAEAGERAGMNNYSMPLVLSGSTLVQPNSDGAVPNAQLGNPHGVPMELLEVRFRLRPTSAISLTSFAGTVGNTVGVKMDLGQLPVVDGYVPVSQLGTARDSYETMLVTSPSNAYQAVYGWRLRHPLFIPPRQVLSCALFNSGANPYPIAVDVAYICRSSVRHHGSHVMVPWVASYESKAFEYTASETGSSDEASPLDIANPFTSSLELSRLTGRVTFSLSGTGSLAINQEDSGLFKTLYGTVRIRSSRGFDIIRTPASMGAVFGNWRSWDLPQRWMMSPGERYSVRVDVSTLPAGIVAARNGRALFSVGVTGYRKVAKSLLGVA